MRTRTLLIAFALFSLLLTATTPKTRCQTNPPKIADVLKLCDWHVRQSTVSVTFDLTILSRIAGKLGLPKTKLIEVSDSIFFLIGQEEIDCRLLLWGVITMEEFRAHQARRLQTLIDLQKYRENAQKAVGESVLPKPKTADPDKLLEELNKKLPPPKGGTTQVPASFLGLSLTEQLDKVIGQAKKSIERSY